MMNIKYIMAAILLCTITFSVYGKSNKSSDSSNVYSYVVKDINKEEVNLQRYEGKVLLIVNVASKCGYTPQYEGLEKIYRKYKSQGFEILAFPCNDFKQQEPGTNEEIQKFCSTNYDVTFQLFDKISVKDSAKAPLYKMLPNNPVTGKSEIKWNFEKFVIDKNGNIVKHFRSKTTPESEELTSIIEELLK
jgi:glutathione peroxidase